MLTALAEPVCFVDPLRGLALVAPPGAQEHHDKGVHHRPDLIGHLAGNGGGRGDQLVALGLVPAEPPVPAGARREPHRPVRLTGRDRTTHREADVVVLDLKRGQPLQLLGAAKMGLRGFGEFGEVLEMRTAREIRFPCLREPVPGVLPDRADHPVARCAVALGEHQRLLGQRGQQLEHLLRLDRVARADPFGRFQARPAGEHREPAQDHPFGVGEQPPAPVDHRAQRPVMWQRSTATAGQQAEPIVEPAGELIEGHGAQPGRGQFDRQRHPVQRPADAHHRRQRAGVGPQILAHRAGPVPQQPDGRSGLDLAAVRVLGRQRQRLDQPQRLTGDAERFPARRQDPQPLALPEYPVRRTTPPTR